MSLEQLVWCEQRTQEELAAWRFEKCAIDPAFASAHAISGRMGLRAESWQSKTAEARLVFIRGATAAIFNALIFPNDPRRAPVFVAELLVTGGNLRICFVDLQTPDLADEPRSQAIVKARELTRRFGARNTSEPAPGWAVEYAADQPAYVRPTVPQPEVIVTDLYLGYLQAWGALSEDSLPAAAVVSPALERFKANHRDLSPVRGYLARVFGETWADQFLAGFLYR